MMAAIRKTWSGRSVWSVALRASVDNSSTAIKDSKDDAFKMTVNSLVSGGSDR